MINVLFWGLSASAFSPDSDNFIGIEPRRIYQFNASIQDGFRQSNIWTEFLQQNPSWKARFDQHEVRTLHTSATTDGRSARDSPDVVAKAGAAQAVGHLHQRVLRLQGRVEF